MKISLLILSTCLLLALGLQPFGLWAFSYIAFLPAFLLAFDLKVKSLKLFFCFLFAGAFYYGILFWGLTLYSPRIFLIIWLLFSFVFAIYFSGVRLLHSKTNSSIFSILASGLLWLLLEKIFALTPLGAAALQLPFYGPLALMQVVSCADFCLLSGTLVGINASAAFFIRKKSAGSGFCFITLLFILSGIYFHGHLRLKNSEEVKNPIKVSLIQHNLPISESWRGKNLDEIYRRYQDLILEAAKASPDLIVLPLYTLPEDPLQNPEFFLNLAKSAQSHILLGSHIPRNPNGSLNQGLLDVAILYAPEGEIAGVYQASQAPPFRDISEMTEGNPALLQASFGKVGILLCFEDIIPKISRRATAAGAEFIAALSNPGHFANTDLPYYHLFQDSLRAIESNRWIVRVSPNGYSAIIDPKGRQIQKSVLQKEFILTGQIGIPDNFGRKN